MSKKTIQTEKERLFQACCIEHLGASANMTEMVTVAQSSRSDDHSRGILSALVPLAIEKQARDFDWLFTDHGGKPGVMISYCNGLETKRYYRFGDDSRMEPITLSREFNDIKPAHMEISEEFRLFHNLYHDAEHNRFLKIDDGGNDSVVADIHADLVRIRCRELRQFLAAKEMRLVIQFDHREHSDYTLAELDIRPDAEDTQFVSDTFSWRLNFGDLSLARRGAFSRLLGRSFLQPLQKEKSGIWGFSDATKEPAVEFIIGVDDDGDDILFPADESKLSNYFGANPGSPNYLTPVFFRKSVLDKYYAQPSKYKVSGSSLWCGSIWHLQMDNHHADKVCAWIGDLGRDLPYQERLHWKSHNIPPEGSISETFYKNQLLAMPSDTTMPDLIFKSAYRQLGEVSQKWLGWSLLIPLEEADMHHLDSIRLLSGDEQRDFDEIVLSLTKLLLDSLNEGHFKIVTNNAADLPDGGIARLEYIFREIGIVGFTDQ